MKSRFIILISLLSSICFAQEVTEKEYNSTDIKVNKFTSGTLTTPYSDKKSPLIIFVMDAGAINRNGNDRMSKNDAFKLLSVALAKEGIASYRFDKRLFRIDALGIQETEILLDQFIEDTKSIAQYFSKNGNYSKVILAGHGQGSLVAIKAAQGVENYLIDIPGIDGIISIAGNAQSIDQIVIQQLEEQAPGLDKSAAIAFKDLKEKGRAVGYEPALESIFAYNLQPFIKSWIKYTPSEEIKSLDTPILIIQGSKDLQVSVSEAERLKESVPDATYTLIDNMNHILREIKGTRLENHKSYNEYWLPIMPEITSTITNFVNQKIPERVAID